MYWYSEVTNSTATDYNLKDTEECKTIFLETAWNISNDFLLRRIEYVTLE